MRDCRVFLSMIFFVTLILASADCGHAQERTNDKNGYDKADRDVLTEAPELVDPLRNVWLPPDVVIKALPISPGMKILDIGAGVGIFTFLMADKLENTGHIYATEIKPILVDYINKKAREKGYNNVTAIPVRQHGYDPFYEKNIFDLILCCETLGGILDIEQFFSDLKSSLARKTGRLYVIARKRVSDFIKESFDFDRLVTDLSSRPDDFPVLRRLDPSVLAFIRGHAREKVPPDIQVKIVADFNVMLSDRQLPYEIIDYYFRNTATGNPNKDWIASLLKNSPNDQNEYVKVLFDNLDESGVFNRKERPLTHLELEQLQMLNKRLLSEAFPINIVGSLNNPYVYYRGKNSIISKIEAAGYKLVQEHKNFQQCYFLEFARND